MITEDPQLITNERDMFNTLIALTLYVQCVGSRAYTYDRSYSSWFNSAKLKHMNCIHVHVLSCKFWIYVYRVTVDTKFTTCYKICIYYYPVSSCCELCIYIYC